jgi:hypothetical protein
MDEVLDNMPTPTKIYRDKSIWVATFIGGPLAAGYLIAENFKAFNEPYKVQKTWLYTIIFTLVIFAAIMAIPDTVKFPNQIIPLVYTAVVYYLVQHFQGEKIATHINTGGEIYGWGRTIGVAITGFVITFAIIFVASLLVF